MQYQGIITITKFGTGYVNCSDKSSILIPKENINFAINGDTVDVEIISENEKVLEVGVRGEKNSDGTEYVKAYVVKKDPSLTEEEVISESRKLLTGYKVPKEVVFRDELPKSNVGKILRRLLK